jgi:hypothetical protein
MELIGTVINGAIVLENGPALPEGSKVKVFLAIDDGASQMDRTQVDSAIFQPAEKKTTLGQRLLKLAGIAKDLPSDMAEQHDHYVHGTPKR